MNRKLLKSVLVDTVPVLTGYLFLGAGFGILLSEAGYGVGWAVLMSLCIYAGSGQYLLVSLLTAGASLVTNAVATLLVNVRHVFYGISLVDTYRDVGKKKGYMIFALTDETYSLVTQAKIPQGVDRGSYCFWVSLLDQCYWIVGCALGNLAGSLLPVDFTGISFVLTALFVTMFTEQWMTHKDHGPAVIGVACTGLCLLIFGSEIFLIPSMAAMAGLLILRRSPETEAAHE